MGIAENLDRLREEIPKPVKIVAVSKTMTIEKIREAYQSGHKLFGENKVQELLAKYPLLPGDIEWHFVGHLQTNKVKLIVPVVKMIHSVDSENLLQLIDKEGKNLGRSVECLLQIRIAREESKFGLKPDSAGQLIDAYRNKEFKNIVLKGLMGMATFTNDLQLIKEEFEFLAGFFHELKNTVFQHDAAFCELSMGMSGDYLIAIKAGATMVRIGSLIFGDRN